MKRTIKLTESDLCRIISESVKRIINEEATGENLCENFLNWFPAISDAVANAGKYSRGGWYSGKTPIGKAANFIHNTKRRKQHYDDVDYIEKEEKKGNGRVSARLRATKNREHEHQKNGRFNNNVSLKNNIHP